MSINISESTHLPSLTEEPKFLVYKHTNPINQKVYIGITRKNPLDRWKKGKGYKQNYRFYKDIEKYNWDTFNHEIIKSNLSEEDAKILEESLILKYNSTNPEKGYNIALSDARGHSHFTEETKEKLRKKRIQYIKDNPEVRYNLSERNKQNWKNTEYRQKMSDIFKGNNNPSKRDDVKLKISESRKKHFLNETGEEKEKRIQLSKEYYTPEIKKKISERTKKAMKNIDMSSIMKNYAKNHTEMWSEEINKKRSLTLKKTYENNPNLRLEASIRSRGKNNPMYGKSPKVKGSHWYNNGEKEGMFSECPEGWIKGRIKKSSV